MTTKDRALRHEVEAPKITDALYDGFRNEPSAIGMDPTDGLPRQVVSHPYEDAQAPPLEPGSMVCMADTSSFVVRDEWGVVAQQFPEEAVERMPYGAYRTRSDTGLHLRVEPIRPQCKYYARQYVPFPEELSHRMVMRLCTARRDDEGEFLDMGNVAIYACELRLPSIGSGAELIDEADAAIMARQREKKALEVEDDFDLEQALEDQMKDPLDQMKQLAEEIAAHTDRMIRTGKVKQLDSARELIETVMPILRDFAQVAVNQAFEVRSYLHEEVEPILEEIEGGGPADSVLFPEDAAAFTALLLRYRAFLDESAAGQPEEKLGMLRAELNSIDEAVARIGEITGEEDPDDEGEEGDEGQDDEGDDEEGSGTPPPVTQ